jgi:hypothetical protein
VRWACECLCCVVSMMTVHVQFGPAPSPIQSIQPPTRPHPSTPYHQTTTHSTAQGIIDSAIQRLGCRSHTILEAHPDVLAKMEAEGWMDK